MTEYTIYEIETGEVVQTGQTSQPHTVPAMLRDGQDYVLRHADWKTQCVSRDKRVIRKRSKDIATRELAEAWRALRARRSQLLSASDWTQVPDAPVDQAAWRAYRQALRDLPVNTTDPRNVEWPEAPE